MQIIIPFNDHRNKLYVIYDNNCFMSIVFKTHVTKIITHE